MAAYMQKMMEEEEEAYQRATYGRSNASAIAQPKPQNPKTPKPLEKR
jgi:hypothetical protein